MSGSRNNSGIDKTQKVFICFTDDPHIEFIRRDFADQGFEVRREEYCNFGGLMAYMPEEEILVRILSDQVRKVDLESPLNHPWIVEANLKYYAI